MNVVENPYRQFTKVDGSVLENGTLYIGVQGLDPKTNLTSVFWDDAGTIPAENPLKITGGKIYRAGTPSNAHVNGAYSMALYDNDGQLIYYALNEGTSDSTMYTAEGSTTARSLASRFADFTNILDYGGDLERADVAAKANSNDGILIPAGVYNFDLPYTAESPIMAMPGAEMNIGANIVLDAAPTLLDGAFFNIPLSQTLTINAAITAGDHVIFNGSGTVNGTFGESPVSIAWWCVADGVANDYAALNRARIAASNAGAPLDMRERTVRTDTALVCEAGKTHTWQGGGKIYAPAITGTIISCVGEALGADILLTANIDPGAVEIPLADASTISDGDLLLVSSDRAYNAEHALHSEFARVKGIVGNTVTVEANIQGRYYTGANAKVRIFPQTTSWINRDRMTIEGGGTGQAQNGLVLERNYRSSPNLNCINTENRGLEDEVSYQTNCPEGMRGENIDAAGLGYLVSCVGSSGCNYGELRGERIRHCITIGDSGSSYGYIMSRNSGCADIHALNCNGSLFDTHGGAVDFFCGNVNGTMSTDSADFAITLQSVEGAIGNVNVRGNSKGAALIQSFGYESSVREGALEIASINNNESSEASGDTDAIVFIEAKDSTYNTPVKVHIGSISGRAARVLHADPENGDVHIVVGALYAQATETHMIYAESTADYRSFMQISYADIRLDNDDNTLYGIYALGDTYTAGHSGVPGVVIRIDAGTISDPSSKSGGALYRAVDAEIYLGSAVTSDNGGGLFLKSGIGDIRQDSSASLT